MPGFLQEHRGPLAGAAGLHLALLAIFAGGALQWTSSQPPVELAIDGYVVEGPVKVRPLREPRESAAAAPPAAAESPPPVPEPPAERREERSAPEAAAAESATQRENERQAAEQRAAAAAQARLEAEQAEAEVLRKAADEQARREAEAAAAAIRREEAEAARRADEEEARRKAEAAEAAQRKAEAEAREAEARAERESALQQRLAAEEAAASLARSGVIDEYRSLLVQTIERNWIRPPSARAGLQCTLYVTQAPGGTVVDVRLGACNADDPVRESIVNAVYRSSPLPAPPDPRAFDRRLEIVFKPTE